MSDKIIAFAASQPPPTYDRPRADRLVDGNPLRTTYQHFLDATGELAAGIWHCEAGAWNIAFAAGKDEFFCVIAGRLRITDRDGASHEFGAGQAGIIPAGFSGTFEVVEAVRKYYVVLERST